MPRGRGFAGRGRNFFGAGFLSRGAYSPYPYGGMQYPVWGGGAGRGMRPRFGMGRGIGRGMCYPYPYAPGMVAPLGGFPYGVASVPYPAPSYPY